MASPAELLFGKLAVMNKMATTAQVEECIQLQEQFAQAGMEMSLGEICLKKKYMTQAQVETVLKGQRYLEMRKEDIRFGELAVSNGFLSQIQVNECLQAQEAVFKQGGEPGRIGQIMLAKKLMNQQQVMACLKAQARMAETASQAAPTEGPGAPPPPRATTASRAPTRVVPSPVVGPPPGRTPNARILPAVGNTQRGLPEAAPAPAQEEATDVSLPTDITAGVSADGCAVTARGSLLPTSHGRSKTIVLLEVEGDLDGHTFPYFEEYINKVMDAGFPNIVVDLRKLNYIASPGIGVIVGAARKCRDAQGDIRLCAVPAKVQPIIEMLGFKNIIRTYDHDKGAINSFKYM